MDKQLLNEKLDDIRKQQRNEKLRKGGMSGVEKSFIGIWLTWLIIFSISLSMFFTTLIVGRKNEVMLISTSIISLVSLIALLLTFIFKPLLMRVLIVLSLLIKNRDQKLAWKEKKLLWKQIIDLEQEKIFVRNNTLEVFDLLTRKVDFLQSELLSEKSMLERRMEHRKKDLIFFKNEMQDFRRDTESIVSELTTAIQRLNDDRKIDQETFVKLEDRIGGVHNKLTEQEKLLEISKASEEKLDEIVQRGIETLDDSNKEVNEDDSTSDVVIESGEAVVVEKTQEQSDVDEEFAIWYNKAIQIYEEDSLKGYTLEDLKELLQEDDTKEEVNLNSLSKKELMKIASNIYEEDSLKGYTKNDLVKLLEESLEESEEEPEVEEVVEEMDEDKEFIFWYRKAIQIYEEDSLEGYTLEDLKELLQEDDTKEEVNLNSLSKKELMKIASNIYEEDSLKGYTKNDLIELLQNE